MDEEEHEVYGGEIPDEGELEGDMDAHNTDVDMATNDEDAVKVFSLFPLFFPFDLDWRSKARMTWNRPNRFDFVYLVLSGAGRDEEKAEGDGGGGGGSPRDAS